MKITYAPPTTPPKPQLKDLRTGEIFRPSNSLEVYMYLGITADNMIITETESTIMEHTINVQNFDFDDCPPYEYELLACTSVERGGINFFHRDITIDKLDHELCIKEK